MNCFLMASWLLFNSNVHKAASTVEECWEITIDGKFRAWLILVSENKLIFVKVMYYSLAFDN